MILLMRLVSLIFFAFPALAEVEVAPLPSVPLTGVAVNGGHVTLRLTLTADSTGGRIELPARMSGPDAEMPAVLQWVREPQEVAVSGALTLSPNETAVLRMEADLHGPGNYAFSLISGRTDLSQGRTIGPYLVTLPPTLLPGSFLTSTSRKLFTLYSGLNTNCPEVHRKPRAASAHCDLIVSVTALNNTQQTFATLKPRISGLHLKTEGADATLDLPHSEIPVFTNCTEPVAPGNFCTIDLYLPSSLGAGTYEMQVSVAGTEGGVSAATLTLTLLSPRWLVGLMAALGALIGAFIAHWRNVDRQQMIAELPFALVADQFRKLQISAHTEISANAGRIVTRIGDALSMWRLTSTEPGFRPETFDTALSALLAAERAFRFYEALPEATKPSYAPLRDGLRSALLREDWEGPTQAAADRLAGFTVEGASDQAGVRKELPIIDLQPPRGLLLANVGTSAMQMRDRARLMDLLTNAIALVVIGMVAATFTPTLGAGQDGLSTGLLSFLVGFGLYFALPAMKLPARS